MIWALLLSLSVSATAQQKKVPTAIKAPPVKKEEVKKDESLIDKAGDAAKKAVDATEEAAKDVAEVMGETRQRRSDNKYFGLVNYSPFDLIIPGKYGATVGMINSADKTWEFEYLRGSLSVPFFASDLGKMTDQKFSLIGRSYFGGNSFNLSYGLTYFDFAFHLGNRLLSKVANVNSIDLIELESIGFNVGIGNRWSFNKNITFGIDWISWSQPVIITKKSSVFLDYVTDPTDKSDVEKTLKWASYFPRFALLKLQLGILF